MEPLCLVEPVPISGALRVNPAALDLLRGLTQPLHILAIFGPCGTGKSFLMDQLAGQGKGFPRSSGIWMWCLPHPTQSDQLLVLLDTEGFPEQEGDETKLSRLFLLDVLLSNIFIYNTRYDSDPQRQLERLTFVRDLPRMVHVLDEYCLENSFLLNSVLPHFAWCLQDMVSDPVLDEVLEATGHDLDSAVSFPSDLENSPVSFIKTLFPCRKLFHFCSPQVDGGQGEPPSPMDPLHPTFQKQMGRFKDYILSQSPKTMEGNRVVDGKFLAVFLQRIVDLLAQDEPILLSEICSNLQQEDSNCSGRCQADPTEGPTHRRAASASAWPLVLEPQRECVVPLQASQPVLPVLTQASAGTVQLCAMEEPICLIENWPDRELQLNQEALAVLRRVHQPVVVVAIVGLYRTGKSYLLNRLAGKDQGGFSLGSTVQSHTKGIWMWCLPHPCRAGHTLVLLDTEGLGDVEKSNTKNDAWIFALAVLLSSTLVYNSMNTIDHYALEKLHYVTELTERIKVKVTGRGCQQEEESAEFIRFFPAFVWAVRDFTLQLKLDGREITEDEYLENALKRREGQSEKLDLPKKYLRQYFPSRKCFVFDCPAPRCDLARLDQLPKAALSPEFLKQAQCFCHYIYQHADTKTLPGGHVVTGILLGNLLVTYVEAICSGVVPCLETAVLALAQIENSAAVEEAVAVYEERQKWWAALPTDSVVDLLELHAQCEQEALRVFMTHAFKDEEQQYQRRLKARLDSKRTELCHQNELVSSKRCTDVLQKLYQELEERIHKGSYSVPGGYQRFLKDQREMAAEALQRFLESKETAVQAILQMDKNLTDSQRKTEGERVRAEAAERKAQLRKAMHDRMEQLLQDQERSHREHIQQLEAKMEDDRRKMLAEQQRVLGLKLQEQERLLRERFQGEAAQLQRQVQSLRDEMSQRQSSRGCVIC